MSDDKREIFFEFVVQGNAVKATAIDSQSGKEASIVGPVHAGRDTLAKTALAKLKYILDKKS